MFTFRILHLNNYFFLSHTLFAQLSLHFHLTRQRRWQWGGSVGCTVAALAERWRLRSIGAATVGSFAAASAAQGRRRQRSGGIVGRAAEAAQQRSGDGGQFCSGVGSARAAEAAQRWQHQQNGRGRAAAERRQWAVLRRRRQRKGGGGSAAAALDAAAAAWRWRAAGRQGGISGGNRAGAAAAAWRWHWHGGRGGGGGSPITPATALPIPLLIAAARLGNVAVSLCGMRGCGGLRGGSVTAVCHIPLNRVDEVVRFAGILTKKV
jgi:hypothetical protein